MSAASPINIRPYRPADKEQLYALAQEFYFKYSPAETVTGDLVEFDSWREDLTEADIINENFFKPGLTIIVAEGDGKLVGFAVGYVREKENKRLNKEGYIAELYVSGENRSKGIGSQLIEAIKAEFRKQDCTHIGLSAFANNTQAIKLYERMGLIEYVVVMKGRL